MGSKFSYTEAGAKAIRQAVQRSDAKARATQERLVNERRQAEERDALEMRVGELEGLLREVASTPPVYRDSDGDSCMYCIGEWIFTNLDDYAFVHEECCLWLRIRAAGDLSVAPPVEFKGP